MSYLFNKFIQDTRAFEDQHPDAITQQLHLPIRYYHKYDPISRSHIFRFLGFWSGFIPRSDDFDTPLFQSLQSEENIERDRLDLLVSNFQKRIVLPVPSPEKTYLNHSLKYNVMLAWIGRSLRFLQEPWVSCSQNPLDLCYGEDEKGLDRFFNVLRATDTIREFFGCPGYILPSVSSIDIVPIINTRNMCFNEIIWFDRHKFDLKFNPNLILPGNYLPFHLNWTYDTPHCIWFTVRKDILRYLIQKAKENVENVKKFYDSSPGPINRPSEAVAMWTSDEEIRDLVLLGNDVKLGARIFNQVTTINERTFWLTFVKDADLRRGLSENILISKQEERILEESGRIFWKRVEVISDQERESQINESSCVVGTEKVAFGTINWIELPLGEEFDISYEQLQATALSSSDYILDAVGQDSSKLELHLGKGVHRVPNTNILPSTHSTEDLEIAKRIFNAIKSNCVWCVSQNSRYLEKISGSTKTLTDGLTHSTFGPVSMYSDLHLLQALFFNELISHNTANIASPSSSAKISYINNSSMKLLSVFKYLIHGAYEISDFNIETGVFDNEQIAKVKKILVVGTINDPFVECLRRAYSGIDIKGFGADAQGKNLRACIEGVGGKNMSCDLLISDVDQTFYDTYMGMEEATISHVLSFLSWSPVVAVKLNYPCQRLFNAINAAIRTAFPDQDYQGFPASVSCQNPFTVECYFLIYPNYYITSQSEKFVYFMGEDTFTTKSVQITNTRMNMSTQPIALASVADKNSFSLYHPADLCRRACPQTIKRITGGSYYAITSHIKRAEKILPILLESCETVQTWKTSTNSDLVNFIGTVSNFRLSVTKRSNSHYYLKLQSRGFGVNSYGVRSSAPRFSILKVVPWYTILSEATRASIMRICEKDERINSIYSVGSRNLTDMFVLRNYEDVTCFDEYRSGGPELFHKYNFHVEERYFDWEHATLKDNLFILANFVIMAPDRSREAVSKNKQLDIIQKMINNMTLSNFEHISFGFSYYMSNYSFMFPKSELCPDGLSCTADPPSISFGDYDPVACLDSLEILHLTSSHSELEVKFFTPNYASLFHTCATHGWVPNAASAPAITLFRHLIQVCIITKVSKSKSNPMTPTVSMSSESDLNSPSNTSSSSHKSFVSGSDLIEYEDETSPTTTAINIKPEASKLGEHTRGKRSVDTSERDARKDSTRNTKHETFIPAITIRPASSLNQFTREVSGS